MLVKQIRKLSKVASKLAQTTTKRPHQQNRGAALRTAQPSVFAGLFVVVCANFDANFNNFLNLLLTIMGLLSGVALSRFFAFFYKKKKKILVN